MYRFDPPQLFKNLFQKSIATSPTLTQRYIAWTLQQAYQTHMGDYIVSQTDEITFKPGGIYIYATSAALRQELLMNKEKLKKIFQEALQTHFTPTYVLPEIYIKASVRG